MRGRASGRNRLKKPVSVSTEPSAAYPSLERVALNQNHTTRSTLLLYRIVSAKTGAHFSHDALKLTEHVFQDLG